MHFKSFSYWLILVSFGISVGVLLLFGMWVGWWGAPAQAWLQSTTEPWIIFYQANEAASDLFVRSLGLAGTVLTGVYGLYKAYYYAERNLPKRLDDFIKTVQNEVLVEDRDYLLEEYASASQGSVLQNETWAEGWRIARQQKALRNFTARLSELNPEIDETLNLLSTATESWEKQKATVHYFQGLDAMRVAELAAKCRTSSRTDVEDPRKQALSNFEAASRLDPKDARALEYAAGQAQALHEHETAISHWSTLAQTFAERGDALKQAEALNNQARCFVARSNDPSLLKAGRTNFLTEARNLLVTARRLCGSLPESQSKTLFRAQVCERLGEVRLALDKVPTARAVLREARNAFAELKRQDDVDRIDAILAEPDQQHPDANLATAFEALAEAYLRSGQKIAALGALEQSKKLFASLQPPNTEGAVRVERRIAELSQ